MIGICFDLDDTIISTSSVYNKLMMKAFYAMMDDMEPQFIEPGELLEIFYLMHDGKLSNHTRKMVEDWAPTHFPRSLADTYVEGCLRHGVIPKIEVAKEVYDIGARVVNYNYRMMPGAAKLVNYLLRRRDVSLFMITRGDPKLQNPKIQSKTSLSRFEKIWMIPFTETKSSYIKKLIEEYDNIDTWIFIGDSIPSDINPALGCGILAFQVGDSKGSLDRGEVITVGDSLSRYFRFNDLEEVYRFFTSGALYDKKVQVKK